MKKYFLIISVATAISGLPAFGQGYFVFTGSPRTVWDFGLFGTASTNTRVSFLWGSGTPAVDVIAPSIPTNNSVGYSYAEAWPLILTDPNFHLAHNNTDGSLAAVNIAANSAWIYSMGAPFPVTGTAPGPYTVYVIAWSYGFVDPAAAAAAGAPVGWSNPFTYTATGQIGTPLPMSQSGLLPFAIGTPEPSMLSLIGLGAATFVLRRRKCRGQ